MTAARERAGVVLTVLLLALAGCRTVGEGAPSDRTPPSGDREERTEPVDEAADEAAVLAVVHGLFDAMRAKDVAAVESSFHPDARLVTTAYQDGEPVVASVPASRLVRSVASAPGDLNEVIWGEEVRIRDNLATVWTEYNFFMDDELHHCGVNAFQLARTSAGWTIVQISDTRRAEGCTPRP